MHRDHHIRRHCLQFGDSVFDVVGRRDAEMETAKHRMQFIGAGDRHGLPDCIDDSTMAAGRNHDQAPAAHDITRRMFIGMEVGYQLAASLSLGEVIGWSGFDQRIWKNPLKRLARNIAGRERAIKRVGGLTIDRFDVALRVL
jgi:hypothetical protein